jgi:hypothetical protein
MQDRYLCYFGVIHCHFRCPQVHFCVFPLSQRQVLILLGKGRPVNRLWSTKPPHKLFSDLVYVSTHLTTLFETDIKSKFQLLFQTFLPCSRKPTLFGHVVAILHEAWQMVSTISRSNFSWHKPLPIVTKTIWKYGGRLCDDYYIFFSQKYWELVEIFQKKRNFLGTWYKICVRQTFYLCLTTLLLYSLDHYCIGFVFDYVTLLYRVVFDYIIIV